MPPSSPLLALAQPAYERAQAAGFPAFLDHPRDSTPTNASPYVTTFAILKRDAQRWPARSHLVAQLERTRLAASTLGLSVEAMLLGGSFTELSNPAPNDVDGLLIYTAADPGGELFGKVAALQVESKSRGADIRFIPNDSDPLILINAISYFTLLYSKSKLTSDIVRGLILVDCRV